MNRDALRARLAPALHPIVAPPRATPSNHVELSDLLPALDALRPAAVLVPIVVRDGEPMLVLTVRTDRLTHHGGQVAFPGGCIEHDDGGPLEAAAREAHEEIGLARGSIEALGYLDRYATITGFDVTPVVALIDPPERYVPHPGEVAEVFEAPLSWVLDPARQERRAREFLGRVRHYHSIAWGEREIWGATAAMIVNLRERIERHGG